jgi:hypothetical protein
MGASLLVAFALAVATPQFAKPMVSLRLVSPATPNNFAAGDFNGDGLVDVLVTRINYDAPGETYPVTLLLNKGNGHFVDATNSIFVGPPPQTQNVRQVIVADFNGDGHPDVFAADTGEDQQPFPGHQNSLILSQPGGKLVDASANLPQQSDFTHSTAAADINGDGAIDLYLGNLSGAPPTFLLNDGTGHFHVPDHALPTGFVASPYVGSALVDVNGDRAPDLVLTGNETTDSVVLLNDGRGAFSVLPNALPPKPWGVTSVALGIAAGDLNGDRHIDLVISATQGNPFYTGQWLQVLINNGDGTFRDETAKRLPGQLKSNGQHWIAFPRLVDVNGDGHLDLLTQNLFPDAITPAYLNNGHGRFKPMFPDAYRAGVYAFVNDKPRQRARDVLTIAIKAGSLERYRFYRRIK